MKKNLLSIILSSFILINLYNPYPALSFNAEKKQRVSISLDKAAHVPLVESDTNKIHISGSGNFSPEKPFNYSNATLNQSVSFDLNAISKRKFSVSFLNKNHSQIAVKIYDIIGNLIIEENVSGKGYFYKVYDLSFYNSDLFIIEVGNSKYNKTKSLVAG